MSEEETALDLVRADRDRLAAAVKRVEAIADRARWLHCDPAGSNTTYNLARDVLAVLRAEEAKTGE